jgi:hypothetical protein
LPQPGLFLSSDGLHQAAHPGVVPPPEVVIGRLVAHRIEKYLGDFPVAATPP